ncbi:XRE family transcriptional regulator [Lentzea sp. NPDC003310]|uniref:nSTAND1 domain-containing NTPase n=1 Tax=Lentzea sp. NPDC003310 TaxID=3154447 RepID=UPI0033A8F9BC
MPRTESPLESADTELGRFAADLRALREKAGRPSYRALASRAHYSAATLSDAAGGKKLPSLAVTLAYVKACGGDVRAWEQRWRDIAAPPEPSGEAPYVGLQAFQKEDADRFHGREKLTEKLVELTRRRPFAGVFGASGSGKSSLLRAGLLPRLEQALVFTPGVQPLDECAVRLAQLTGHSAVVLRSELTDPEALGLLVRQHDEDLVLVIDQFEEVFTLASPEQRDWFVQALLSAPHVVIGVRADFYGHVGRHPDLVEALDGAQLLVGPLTTDELRRAIVEPAQRVGATVESALVTRLVADVAGQAAALPLVQHALVETWHRRRGMTLSLVGYEEAGGVEHAIARTAESVYEQFDDDQRQHARRTFLRLVALGDGTEDTKRRADREDLDADVLERLATARLVTLTEQHAELTHEALIRSWPRLRDWIAEDREALRVHHRLTEAARQWDGDRDLLYQGARLAQAGELDPDSLTEAEREFLTASQAAGRRRVRRGRAVIAVLSVLVLLLAGTVVFAVSQTREVEQQRNEALIGRAATDVMRLIPADPRQAARLALAAHAVTPSQATRDALLNADAARLAQAVVLGPDLSGARLTLPSDGELLIAVSRSGPARIVGRYDASSGGAAFGTDVAQVELTADDRWVFAYERSGEVGIWDVADLRRPKQVGALPLRWGVDWLEVNRDGTWAVAATGLGERVRLWDLRDPARPREIVLPGSRATHLLIAPSGREVLLTSRDDTGTTSAQIWHIGDGEPRPGRTLRVPPESVPAAISDDGSKLAVRSGKEIVVWDFSAEPREWVTVPRLPDGSVTAVAFSPGGEQLAVLGTTVVDVWDVGAQGDAVSAGSFGSINAPDGLRYRLRAKSFGIVDGRDFTWTLTTDLDKVRDGLCREREIELTDDEWRRYFPGVERVPVC